MWTMAGATVFVLDSATTRIWRISPSAQMTINGNTNDSSAQFQVESTTRGFLPPRTSATSLISSPAQGLITYVTGSNDGLYYYNNNSQVGWHKVLTNTGSQSISGSLTLRGSGTTNATTTLTVQNSNASTSLRVRDDSSILFGGSLLGLFPSTNKGQSVNSGAGGLFIGYLATGDLDYPEVPSVTIGRPNDRLLNSTSGTTIMGSVVGNYSPTSGTGAFTALEVIPTINQTGGANGITRGLYINPTLTSAANFRAIETTAGNVLFQSGSTPLMLVSSSGNVGIGLTSSLTALDVRSSNTQAITPLNTIPNAGTTLLIGSTGTNGVLSLGQNNAGESWLQGRSRLGDGSSCPILLNPLGGSVSIGTSATGWTFSSNTLTPLQNGFIGVDVAGGRHFNITNTAFSTYYFRVAPTTGNILIGTTTDSGYRLDVSGSAQFYKSTSDYIQVLQDANSITFSPNAASYLKYGSNIILSMKSGGSNSTIMHGAGTAILAATSTGVSIRSNVDGTAATSMLQVRGSGATSATTTFLLQNSTPTNLLTVLDNGQVTFTTPTMSLAASQSAFSISPIISASNIVGGQYYGVSITPTFFQTTGSQTETAFRVAATFTSSNATATTGSNIIADFGSTSAGSQLTVTDVTSGSIYMVNDVSGIPIIEATSNWDVNMYDFPNKIFEKTGSQVNIYGTMRVSGSFILPLSQSTAPQTGSAYWSGSLLFIYNGTRYMSSSFA